MSRVKLKKIDPIARRDLLDLLWTGISQLDSRDETKAFFKDLLSESEAIMLARRIKVAQLLLANESYNEIEVKLGVSKGTIAKVHNWLNGGFGGYEATITRFNRVVEKREKKIKANQAKPFSYEWMKRKYPLHFLLFNLFDEASIAMKRKK